jgi:hypothetical protein
MSLLDALLLEPHPLNVWIAYRTDSIKGSGTMSDPYDGAPKLGPSFAIATLTHDGLTATATLESALPSGYADGDVLVIEGVTGAGAGRWNGAFVIFGLNPARTQFSYCMTGIPAAIPQGTDEPKASKVLAFRLDALLNSLPSKTRVHLGPTPAGKPFLTRGYADDVSGGW